MKVNQIVVQTHIECDKCHKPASYVLRKKIVGKGKVYTYDRFLHIDHRKKSKRRYCYYPVSTEAWTGEAKPTKKDVLKKIVDIEASNSNGATLEC